MRHICFLFFSLLTLLPLSAARHYETVPGDLTKTRIYTLDNGLKVYLSVNQEKPRIQTYIAVRTGSKNDPAETTGLAHYLEHLMFKGTTQFGTNNAAAEAPLLADIEQRYEVYRKMTDPAARKAAYHAIDSVSQLAARYFIPNEYDKLMSAIGAQGTNAFTSNDVTCYVEDIPSNEIDNWARIQSDRFQHMVIRGFHTELEAVYEEYNMYLSEDGEKVFQALGKKLMPTHPYGNQTTIGTQDHLKNPSITNIKRYFQHWYVPNNVAICMAGDLDPDKTIAIIERHFGSWKPATGPDGRALKTVAQPVFPEQRPLTAPADTTIIGQQADQVWMAWLAKKGSDLQCDTLDVIEHLLSNGRAGLFDLHLNQQMRVLQAGAGLQTLQDYSQFLLMGVPSPGQSLEDVRTLMLGEIEHLKQGRFSDDLLSSVVNNMKLKYQQSLDDNRWRVRQHMESFVNGETWQQTVGKIERISHMTKQQIVAFANRYFTDGYATVFKRQGVDPSQKKIEKPAITPIPTNRDQMSRFVRDIQQSVVEPIQPVFLDFRKDLTVSTVKNLPLLYKQNTENDLFTLNFYYEFGHEDDNRYDIAANYLEFVGTDKWSAADVKQQFYRLACDFHVQVNPTTLYVTLTGLQENMPEALRLMEQVLQHAQGDAESYGQYVDLILKGRQDAKSDQRTCFDYLYHYGVYGPHNIRRDDMTEQQLRSADPQQLLDLLTALCTMRHTVLYYGPMSQKQLAKVLAKEHKTPKTLAAVPEGVPYAKQQTAQDEIWIAPYDAKNIYLRMYHNEGRPFNLDEAATIALFNQYFGGGMNGIVFQELRESRGLAYNAMALYERPTLKGESESYFTHIITQNDKMMDCISQFHHILDTIPQSEAAFQIAKEQLQKQLASQRTTKSNIFMAYLAMKRLGFDFDINKKIYDDLQHVTFQDIVRFEQQQMAHKHYRYLLLGNDADLDIPALEKMAPIRRLTQEEVFGY